MSEMIERVANAIRDSGEGCLSGLAYVDPIIAARAVIEAMREPDANGWMPIESAPKDGTKVLIWDHGVYAAWCENEYVWVAPGTWIDNYSRSDTYDYSPTHWRPLPLPPVSNSLPLTPEASTPAGEDHTPPSVAAGTNSEAQP